MKSCIKKMRLAESYSKDEDSILDCSGADVSHARKKSLLPF